MGPDLQGNQADQNWAREGELKAEACSAQTHNRQPTEPMNSIWKDLLPPLSESTRKERDSPGRKGRWRKEGKIASKERNIGRSPSLSTVANSSTEDKRKSGGQNKAWEDDRLIIPGLHHRYQQPFHSRSDRGRRRSDPDGPSPWTSSFALNPKQPGATQQGA